MPATWAPVRPIRPWVHRTALGSPVEPDVKMSRKRSSSDGGGTSPSIGRAASSAPAWSDSSVTNTRSDGIVCDTPSSRWAWSLAVTSAWQSVWSISWAS